MKITVQQLRKLVMSEVKRSSRAEDPYDYASVAGEGAADEMSTYWTTLYDESDPTMSEAGPEAWNEQVNRACDALVNEVKNVIDDVEAKLLQGEYYESSPSTIDDPDHWIGDSSRRK